MSIPYSRTVVGSLPWYSVLIVTGIALAVYLASKEETRLGLPKDTAVDLALVVVPCGIVGARLYYVLMSWEMFAAHPLSILYVWEGGLAIYGAVIGGAIGAALYAWRRKLSFAVLADAMAPGVLLAQAIGRWGNYFNMEAYGVLITDPYLQFFPLAVQIPALGGYEWHAATFFYESVWNLLGFAALWTLRTKQREKGNVFAWYLLLYGAGRFVIEQLRMDSLYLGALRVSQYLSLVLCGMAIVVLLARAVKRNARQPWRLVVYGLLYMTRWFVLGQTTLYAVLALAMCGCAAWLKRINKKALLLLATAVIMDAAGLLAGGFVHALLCSAALPAYVLALDADE